MRDKTRFDENGGPLYAHGEPKSITELKHNLRWLQRMKRRAEVELKMLPAQIKMLKRDIKVVEAKLAAKRKRNKKPK